MTAAPPGGTRRTSTRTVHTMRTLLAAGALASGALVAAAAAAAPLRAQSAPSQTAHASARPAATRGAGWTALFDGTQASLARNWRGYRRNDMPSNWHVENGTLMLGQGGDSTAHGDLLTRDAYGDFELDYDWRISPGGNSGVIYRVAETEPESWGTGMEMQVLDDSGHADGKKPSHRAGALYDLVAPPPGVARPVGQFNHARIVMHGMHVQQYLNGRLTADLDLAGPRGRALIAESKWKEYPHFASQRAGHIALQDHGNVVAFRNIRIRRLDNGGGADTAAAARGR